jgi:hypothetical protein
MTEKSAAVQNLLNKAIDLVHQNRLAQSGVGAVSGYLASQAVNQFSPIGIDPEAAAVAGAFMAPVGYRKLQNMGMSLR